MVGDGDIKYDKYNKFDNKNIHTHSNEVEYSALFMALEIYWRLPPRKSSLVKHTQRTYSPPAVVSSSPNRLSYLFIIYIIRYSFSTFFLYIYFIDIVTERKKMDGSVVSLTWIQWRSTLLWLHWKVYRRACVYTVHVDILHSSEKLHCGNFFCFNVIFEKQA